MTFGEALAYVYSGQYGPISEIGYFNSSFIVVQLMAAGFICILLDDLLQQGYGLGHGISLFIASNICENIFWRCFSPITLRTDAGTEFEGSIVGTFHALLNNPNKKKALYHAFFRSNAPNLNSLLATLFIFFIVIYFQGWKVEIPLRSLRMRGVETTLPIKLFYTSSTPIILQTALVGNLYFISQVLYKRFSHNVFIRFLGVWQELDNGYRSIPVSGKIS